MKKDFLERFDVFQGIVTFKLSFEYGFDQQGWYGMFVACGIWCLADVSSVSPSSEQTAPTKG